MVACRHLGEPALCLHTAALWIIYCGFKKTQHHAHLTNQHQLFVNLLSVLTKEMVTGNSASK